MALCITPSFSIASDGAEEFRDKVILSFNYSNESSLD